MTRRLHTLSRSVTRSEGFTLIEIIVAMFILVMVATALYSTFDTSRKLVTNAELRNTAIARAQGEIERIEALPWTSIALKTAPTKESGATATNPTYYISTASCESSSDPPATSPCYQWNWEDSSSKEPFVVNEATTDT